MYIYIYIHAYIHALLLAHTHTQPNKSLQNRIKQFNRQRSCSGKIQHQKSQPRLILSLLPTEFQRWIIISWLGLFCKRAGVSKVMHFVKSSSLGASCLYCWTFDVILIRMTKVINVVMGGRVLRWFIYFWRRWTMFLWLVEFRKIHILMTKVSNIVMGGGVFKAIHVLMTKMINILMPSGVFKVMRIVMTKVIIIGIDIGVQRLIHILMTKVINVLITRGVSKVVHIFMTRGQCSYNVVIIKVIHILMTLEGFQFFSRLADFPRWSTILWPRWSISL